MANYRKSIEFQARLDTSEIGASIENLKKQFSSIATSVQNAQSQGQTASRLKQQGFGGIMSVPKADEIQKSKRALDLFIREEAQQQERLYRLIENQRNKMEKLQSIKRNMLKDSKEELAIEEKRVAAQEELIRLNDQYQQRSTNINKALDMRSGSYGGMLSKESIMAIGKGVGAAASILTGISAAAERMAGYPMRLEEAKGSATQSFVGRDIAAIQSGQAPFDMPWMGERARAGEMARSKRMWNHATDIGMGLGGLGMMGAGGLLAGAAGWTGIGALAGGGLMAGGSALLSNDRYRGAINPFGQEGYNQLLSAQQGTDTLSTWEALKQQNPKKAAAIERLRQRSPGDLQTQRMMGLSDAGLLGFQQSANTAGFNEDMGAGMAAQIQGAGGSAGRSSRLSVLGLQAQRGFDLTNAGGVLGRISGQVGNEQRSEQVFRKLMEESVRAGLDTSALREEQRRFADTTSEILANSGVRTAEDAATVLQGFSRFLGENPTVRGIEGAKNAYQEAQGFSAETSGRGGVLQFAGIMKDDVLRKSGTRGASGIMEMPLQDVSASNPFIVSEASAAGVSPEDFAARVRKMKVAQSYTAVGLDQAKVQRMDQALTARGISGAATYDQLQALQREDGDDYNTYIETQRAVSIRNQYAGPQKREADFLGFRRGLGPTGGGEVGGAYDQRMAPGVTGRAADELVAASGVAAQAMLENFRNLKDEVTPAAAGLKQFVDVIMATSSAAIDATNALNRYLQSIPAPLRGQVQAGKPSR